MATATTRGMAPVTKGERKGHVSFKHGEAEPWMVYGQPHSAEDLPCLTNELARRCWCWHFQPVPRNRLKAAQHGYGIKLASSTGTAAGPKCSYEQTTRCSESLRSVAMRPRNRPIGVAIDRRRASWLLSIYLCTARPPMDTSTPLEPACLRQSLCWLPARYWERGKAELS